MPWCLEGIRNMRKEWQGTVALEDDTDKLNFSRDTVLELEVIQIVCIFLTGAPGPAGIQCCRINRSRCQSYTGLVSVHLDNYHFQLCV